MEIEDIKKLALSIDGDVFFNQSIKNLNWFNIGGKTKIFFKPNSLKGLIEYLKLYSSRGKIFILTRVLKILIGLILVVKQKFFLNQILLKA